MHGNVLAAQALDNSVPIQRNSPEIAIVGFFRLAGTITPIPERRKMKNEKEIPPRKQIGFQTWMPLRKPLKKVLVKLGSPRVH